MRTSLILLALMALFTASVPAQDSGAVKRAYQAIPHRYTEFDSGLARMTPAQQVYLEKNFELVNRAVVARVEAMQTRDFPQYRSRVRALESALQGQRVPTELREYHSLLVTALAEQAQYFSHWAQQPSGSRFNPSHPLVRSSSAKLRQAYGILMQRFPDQSEEIKRAFFDHLCALDFI